LLQNRTEHRQIAKQNEGWAKNNSVRQKGDQRIFRNFYRVIVFIPVTRRV